jgi:hypothetical protein
MKVKRTLITALLLCAASLMAFGGVKFVKTWKNPEAQPVSWQGKKVAVFTMTALVNNREGAEKALARELTQRGAQAVLGYTLVPPAAEKDREAVKRILTDAGISGAVIMRVVDLQTGTVANSGEAYYMGTNYSSFWGYWDYGMVGYIPPTVKTKTIVMIETMAYSIDQDRLLWAGTSEATDPKKADDLIKKLVGDAANEVKKAGLVKR